jgi:Na+-driven multidrug efflux pump
VISQLNRSKFLCHFQLEVEATSIMNRSTRIVANTIASYARLAVAAAAGFVTVPIVLRTLGATDYGIFSVIAGCLSFLLFINGALTTGAQRHIAYSLGEGNIEEASQWFTASLVVHTILGLALFLLGLLATDWVIYGLLSIPPARLAAAVWIYRFVIVALLSNIISTPYQALLMARESIVVLSLITICGSVFLLAGVLCLRFLPGDALVWYSGIYVSSQVILLVGPMLFCWISYPECRHFSRSALRRDRVQVLLHFSGWSLVGNLAGQIRNQGPAILLNRFVGTMANAAYGVAMQINGFATNFSGGVLRATSPAIVKYEASRNRRAMLLLSNLSSKYAFTLLWLAVGPILCDLAFCLRSWLHQVPPAAGPFSSLLLMALLVDQLTAGFMASVQARGRIALYQCLVSIPSFISVSAGYFMLYLHHPVTSVLWAGIAGTATSGGVRLWFVCETLGLRARDWLSDVLFPCVVICVGCVVSMEIAVRLLTPGLLRLLMLFLLNTVLVVLLGWIFATSEEERCRCSKHIRWLGSEMSKGHRKLVAVAIRGRA